MEEKKKGKGLKIVLVIFIILFLLTAGALGYGYTKYQKLKNDNNNLNTKYENANKDYDNLKNENTKINDDLKKEQEKGKTENVNYHNYLESDGFNIYAMNQHGIVVAYKGNMYKIIGDIDNYMVSKSMIKKAHKKKNGVKYAYVKATNEDDDDYYEWKACKSMEYIGCTRIMDINVKENEVNRVISQGYPGATGFTTYTVIVKKDGTVYGNINEGTKNKTEKIDLKYDNVDDIEITCKKRGDAWCDVILYKMTLKDGKVVEQTRDTGISRR